MSSPGAPSTSKYGTWGRIFNPPLITNMGMDESLMADMVTMPGVGIPSGVTGTPSMHLHLPKNSSSMSAAGVKSHASGLAPAADRPGIFAVSVLPITQVYVGDLPQMRSRNFLPNSSSKPMAISSGTLNDIYSPQYLYVGQYIQPKD